MDGESNTLAPVGGKVLQAGRAAWRKLGLGDCPSLFRIALFAELEEVDRAPDVYLVVAEDVVHKDLRVGVANTQPTTQVNGEDAQAPSEFTEELYWYALRTVWSCLARCAPCGLFCAARAIPTPSAARDLTSIRSGMPGP